MAEPQPPALAKALREDGEGVLPWPWVAACKVGPPEQGSLYYCNEETGETRWERPQVFVTPRLIYRDEATGGHPIFGSWKDEAEVQLPIASPAEAAEAFRDFCTFLFARGVFGRRESGMLWRLGDTESLGIVLYPATRRAAVAYHPQKLIVADFNSGGAFGDKPTGPLSAASKMAALQYALGRFAAAQTGCATLVEPGAYLLRRYVAEVGGTAPPAPRPECMEAQTSSLAAYLESLGLIAPYTCKLTGVANLKSEAELASHLCSPAHRAWRGHLRTAAALLAEVRRGQASVSKWLPASVAGYRNALQWVDHRFQEMPMSDGRVFLFDHLVGVGAVTPNSEWIGLGKVPPPLVPRAGQAQETQVSGHIWSLAPDAATHKSVSGIEYLLEAVRDSLGSKAGGQAAVPTDEADSLVEPPWQLHIDKSGYPYYYNEQSGTTMWERPPLVSVGQSWSNNAATRARATPEELYQRYHRLAPRPLRAVPQAMLQWQ